MAYWYNVNSGRIEQDGDTESKDHLMGPYATEDEARAALETSRARNEAWDEQDKKWDGEE
ncbi:methionine aminopeptidase [Yimella sp. cx-51]|uniref:methionine aminopeptidase n=1 Tax=Yimella sp. cx-51 TaxID=2770551 RepID=UPI00165E7E40|nr:methionine aminopeptidase [Yimella sp. cx-51]MBC9956968.1 methionine aminopeptidase [Yimella sp. cx-51]MBD2760033.1 methionine aminopeptidase [Yimella sp. cx-573]QTH39184.1 methionine aminopeptidase [Yimella sp. cx-51]